MTTQVYIGAGEVSQAVLEGVTVRYGRDRIDDPVDASSCTFQLLATNAALPTVSLRDVVKVTVDGVTVFRGKVTDRSIDVPYIETGRVGTVTTVIATGALSELGRIRVGGSSYPSELDGARVSRILLEAAPQAPALDTITDPIDLYAYSFDYWASAGTETIDPGTVTLITRAAATAKALDAVGEASSSAGSPGLYETPDGRYGYADARRRSKNTTAFTLDAAVIGAQLTYASRIGTILNTATVSYGTASPQATYTETDAGSVAVDGIIAKSYTTSLANLTDAQDLAKRIVRTRTADWLNLEQITVRLDDPALPAGTKTALTGLTFGTPLTLTNLDSRLGLGTTWQGFVEGWTLTARQGREAITLAVSARIYSLLLATVDQLSSDVDRLEGAVDGLAELWAPNPLIDAVSATLDSQTAISIDRAYKIA